MRGGRWFAIGIHRRLDSEKREMQNDIKAAASAGPPCSTLVC